MGDEPLESHAAGRLQEDQSIAVELRCQLCPELIHIRRRDDPRIVCADSIEGALELPAPGNQVDGRLNGLAGNLLVEALRMRTELTHRSKDGDTLTAGARMRQKLECRARRAGVGVVGVVD